MAPSHAFMVTTSLFAILALQTFQSTMAAPAPPTPAPTAKCMFKNWKLGVVQRYVVVYKGTKCTWVWADDQYHCLQFWAGPVRFTGPSLIGKGKTWSYTFTKPGDYKYYCCIHAAQMRGRITVLNQVCPTNCGKRCWGGNGCNGLCPYPKVRNFATCTACCNAQRAKGDATIPACLKACQKKAK